MSRFTDKVAVITGPTLVEPGGLNIAGAVAVEIAAEGGRVVLAGRDPEGTRRLERHLNEKFGEGTASAFQLDLTSEEQIAALMAHAVETFGAIDILLNIAAVYHPADGDIAGMSVDAWDNVMDISLRGSMLTTKHALPELVKRRGTIVNTSSTHALAGDSSFTAYGCAKAGVIALTEYTATQYWSAGVRCNAVVPGVTTSPKGQQVPQPVADIFARQLLREHSNSPQEAAKVYAFLASADSAGMNGAAVRVDAGMFAHQPFTQDLLDFGASVAASSGGR
ncbi:SDR family oxidoreductase [Kineosporia sp. J2-2]|uniref:SDR family oxidoreductase n=1 Tax=Kineosporia corallincola TaxID=2835133 RepID=A0ABS5TC71_9ACTN|nr:SDR family oxidoreductase [Kineosporia corallincola]MBT0768636.1 SDR family oxidoreductase [Kineosporia corallincola]